MFCRPPKSTAITALAAALSLAAYAAVAQDVLVNNVGYESGGPKRVVVQSASAIAATRAYLVEAVGGRGVDTVNLGAEEKVAGWSGRNFRVADFSAFTKPGAYRVRVGAAESPVFSIGEKLLQAKTGADAVGFFSGMRSDDDRDRDLPIFGGSSRRNIYGGWWDANGDPGKHISHLSYANYFNPQQIPLVVWALLHADELQPETFGAAAKAEAAWGADYLLRALSSGGYFYMSVFDNWGGGYTIDAPKLPDSKGDREICAWSYEAGIRSGDYQCAMREGGGVSVAALARAYKAGISGDSAAAQYLAGAKRAYEHLKANPHRYQDDGKDNIIDDYCGLLAASELYNATGEETYRADADARAAALLARQHEDGWFYSGTDNDGANIRPFYHAADEGMPVVALSRYYEIVKARAGSQEMNAVRYAVGSNLRWYDNISRNEGANPFQYAKMYRAAGGSGGVVSGGDLARGRPAVASREEGDFKADKAFDGNDQNPSRWSSYQNGAQNDSQWIYVELDDVYKVNRVVLNWEDAYGRHYRIDVSVNGTNWTKVFEIANNESAGRKEHAFTPADAKYVRMYGVKRGLEYGGFSLFSFEVYGEPSAPPPAPKPYEARYFVPHENETGYWWQGENARIASMAAAFIIGAPVADNGAALWKDTLFAMATAQLDWILGKNPFKVCMMDGYKSDGAEDYPAYPAGKFANVKGGICNGITAKRSDQNDIEWMPFKGAGEGDETWRNWRWIEQWLPHNAWYLTAVSALSHRIENGIEDDPIVIAVRHSASAKSARLKISAAKGMGLRITLPFAADDRTEAAVYNIRGKKVYAHKIQQGLRAVSMRLPTVAKGTYIVDIKDGDGKNRAFGKVIFR